MEVAAVVVQQAMLQQSLSIAMVKAQANVEQALVDMVAQAAAANGNGTNLDISV